MCNRTRCCAGIGRGIASCGATSATAAKRPQVPEETVALIKRMAAENRRWGAARIRGELLKRGITIGKRTMQRHRRGARRPGPRSQTGGCLPA